MKVIGVFLDRQNKANLPCPACSVPVRAFGEIADWMPDGKPQSAARRKRLTASLQTRIACKTKPISSDCDWLQMPCGKRVMKDRGPKQRLQNKANSRLAADEGSLADRVGAKRCCALGSDDSLGRAGTLALRRARGRVFALFIRRRRLHLEAFGVGR
jgi:hypothetical protein